MTEGTSIYSLRYVAFLDILGFSSMVRHSEQSSRQAEALVHIFDRLHKRWSDEILQGTHRDMGEYFCVRSFSDCTVMSEAATPKGLVYLLLMVTQLTRDLMGCGFLVRGGIAKGGLHHSDKAVFGPAFLDAYALERDIACYPRIVVDRNTHKDFENDRHADNWDDFTRPSLCYDEDGPVFVDILSAFRIREEDRIYPPRVLLNGQNIRASIQAYLNESIYIPAHYKKMRWLAEYWNEVRAGRRVDLLEPIDFPAVGEVQKEKDRGG